MNTAYSRNSLGLSIILERMEHLIVDSPCQSQRCDVQQDSVDVELRRICKPRRIRKWVRWERARLLKFDVGNLRSARPQTHARVGPIEPRNSPCCNFSTPLTVFGNGECYCVRLAVLCYKLDTSRSQVAITCGPYLIPGSKRQHQRQAVHSLSFNMGKGP
jgi:hypothetical protein